MSNRVFVVIMVGLALIGLLCFAAAFFLGG